MNMFGIRDKKSDQKMKDMAKNKKRQQEGDDYESDDDEDFGGMGGRHQTRIYKFDYDLKFDDDLDEGNDFKR